MITLPHRHSGATCPHCARRTGVTFGSVTIWGSATTVYLGCSLCDYEWWEVLPDLSASAKDVEVSDQPAASPYLM